VADDQMFVFVNTVTALSVCDVLSDEGTGLSPSHNQLYMLTTFTILHVYIMHTSSLVKSLSLSNTVKPHQFRICDNLDNFFFVHCNLDHIVAT
jgi:hypothetical protein